MALPKYCIDLKKNACHSMFVCYPIEWMQYIIIISIICGEKYETKCKSWISFKVNNLLKLNLTKGGPKVLLINDVSLADI